VRLHFALICIVAAFPLSGCSGLYGDDQLEAYAQRKDTVTLSAGDAKEVNARTHMIAAWPRGVGDRAILMGGNKGVRAMECYRQGRGQQLVSDSRGQTPSGNQTNVGGSGGAGGGAGGTAGGGGPASQLKC